MKLFLQDVVSEAQSKIAEWKEEALCLTKRLAQDDAVIQTTLGVLKSLEDQLETLAKLQSPTLKQKHWRAIFEGQTWNIAFIVKAACSTVCPHD